MTTPNFTIDTRTFTDPMEAIDAGRRWCYAIPANAVHDSEGFVPSLVVEGVAGHFPMLGNGPGATPWYWGKTREQAEAVCASANAKRGVDPETAAKILLSSIGTSIRER